MGSLRHSGAVQVCSQKQPGVNLKFWPVFPSKSEARQVWPKVWLNTYRAMRTRAECTASVLYLCFWFFQREDKRSGTPLKSQTASVRLPRRLVSAGKTICASGGHPDCDCSTPSLPHSSDSERFLFSCDSLNILWKGEREGGNQSGTEGVLEEEKLPSAEHLCPCKQDGSDWLCHTRAPFIMWRIGLSNPVQ